MGITKREYYQIYNQIVLFIIGYLQIQELLKYYIFTLPLKFDHLIYLIDNFNDEMYNDLNSIIYHISSIIFGGLILFVVLSFIDINRKRILLITDIIIAYLILFKYDCGEMNISNEIIKCICLGYCLLFISNRYMNIIGTSTMIICLIDEVIVVSGKVLGNDFEDNFYWTGFGLNVLILLLCFVNVGKYIVKLFCGRLRGGGFIKIESDY